MTGVIITLLLFILFMIFIYNNISQQPIKFTDAKVLDSLRTILNDIHNIFIKHNISYWIDGGTLLGAVRHNNVIPWDDDGDIIILDADENKLASIKSDLSNLGYGLTSYWGGYKIYSLRGAKINGPIDYDYTYPFVDIFIMKKDGDRYVYANDRVANTWKNTYYDQHDFIPRKLYKFGTHELYGPANAIPYLNRLYGSNWRKEAYISYDHSSERQIKPIKFNI